jgi:hypothetical protein
MTFASATCRVPGGRADFSAEELTLLAAPLADEALWDEPYVLASITPQEQALIDEANAAPQPPHASAAGWTLVLARRGGFGSGYLPSRWRSAGPGC